MEKSSHHSNVQSSKQQNVLIGYGVDIHNIIGTSLKTKSGWVLPKHHYCRPYNSLEKQLAKEGNQLIGHEPYSQANDICKKKI